MTSLTFPVLAGQGWSVRKTPRFSTRIAPHVSGREVRDALYLNPIWEYEAVFDALDSSPATYPGLGAQSLQSLMGLFLQCQGPFGTFVYYDPTDYVVSGQPFGVGNGSTTSFQLTRSLGGFSEAVVAPFVAPALTMNPLMGAAGGKGNYAPNNYISNSIGAGAVAGTPGAMPTDWANWYGNGVAFQLVGTGVENGVPYVDVRGFGTPTATTTQEIDLEFKNNIAAAQSQNWIASSYLQLVAGSLSNIVVELAITEWSASFAYLAGGGSPVTPNSAPLNTQRYWTSRTLTNAQTAYAMPSLNVLVTGGLPVDYTIRIGLPQLEKTLAAGSAPQAAIPTAGAPNFGSPQLYCAGVVQNPSTYAIANGLVTFATPPAVGAALTWSGYFGFLCRFDDDKLDFEQFMQNLWKADSVKFRSVRAL